MKLSNQKLSQSEIVIKLWEESHKLTSDSNSSGNFIQQSPLLNTVGRSKNQVVAFINFAEARIISYSENFNDLLQFNLTDEEIKSEGLSVFLNALNHDQCKYFADISEFFLFALRPIATKDIDYEFFSNGFTLNLANGIQKRISFLGIPVEFNDFVPITMMIVVNEVTNILKDDEKWWSRLSMKTPQEEILIYQNSLPKFVKAEIISLLEFDIIKLFDLGLGMVEISEKLNISYHTTDYHRKNILSKTNTINITAAIQILKQGNIL